MNPELLKRLDPYARTVGLYTSYTLSGKEYIGSVPYAIPGTHRYLSKNGYEDNPTFAGVALEAAKLHPETGDVHDWSYRKVDPRDNRKQYHIHGWKRDYHKGPPQAYDWIYSHREYRPDVKVLDGETVPEAIERLRTHYRPTYGETYEQGKACDDLRELVE